MLPAKSDRPKFGMYGRWDEGFKEIEQEKVYLTMHMAAAPAVRAAVKTELPYRNDTVGAFFFAANKNKDNAKVALASSNS